MKVTKWVDMGQEVEVEISTDDIRAALLESFNAVTMDRLGEDGPSLMDVVSALNSISQFLNALAPAHIAMLTSGQRVIIATFLRNAADKLVPVAEAK